MINSLMDYLNSYKNKTITLSQLESQASGANSYTEFTRALTAMEATGVIEPFNKADWHPVYPTLANRYRVNKQRLKQDQYTSIRAQQAQLHPLIDLASYFTLSGEAWEQDQSLLVKLDNYLKTNGLPCDPAPAPERSYQIFQDEKCLTEGLGKTVLERVGLWHALKITPVPEPLMFALNPQQISAPLHQHLIVENKTTWQALLPALIDTSFTTLIYGSGKGFLNSILYLERQLNLQAAHHQLFYFGDLDLEGINIWHSLNKLRPAQPATLFYTALLDKPHYHGKTNHRKNPVALTSFSSYFQPPAQLSIERLFEAKAYYPQEALSGVELCHLWRDKWTDL